MDTLPLSELAGFIRRVFALNLPEPVWVSAELGEVSESRGHVWLSLVEKETEADGIRARMEAVVWQSTVKKLRGDYGIPTLRGLLQTGMSVRLRVTASFHERYGIKLVVDDVDPAHTLGVLEARRQATLEALERDGLLDRNARLPFPPLPLRLAVISSETAAGLSDFTDELDRNPHGYRFSCELFPAAMQGARTTEEIGKQLRRIARRRAAFDAIALVRGGGGKTDLAVFDDEGLCRALAAAPLPAVTGIGHEVDHPLVDRVVHRSCKTPTASAGFLIECVRQQEARLLHLGRTVREVGQQQLAVADRAIEAGRGRVFAAAALGLQRERQLTVQRHREVWLRSAGGVQDARNRLDSAQSLLTALRPETTLARGFALVSQDGKLLTDAEQLRDDSPVEVRLNRGRLRLPPA